MVGNILISAVNCFPPHFPPFVLLKYNSLNLFVKVWGIAFFRFVVGFFKIYINFIFTSEESYHFENKKHCQFQGSEKLRGRVII